MEHPDHGRRHYDTLAQETLSIVKKYGPVVATLVMLGALGSCGITIASAFGFPIHTTGARLTAVEMGVDSLRKDNITVKAAIADLVLLRCGDSDLNATQKGICARWEHH